MTGMTGMTGTTGGVPGDVTGQELYHRWIEEAWNGHPEAVRGLVTADFTGHWPGREVHGADELAELIASTRRMFTSLRFVIEVGPFAANGLVAGRWSGVGRTDGGEARFFGNDILRVRDGRFAEYWVASGQLGG